MSALSIKKRMFHCLWSHILEKVSNYLKLFFLPERELYLENQLKRLKKDQEMCEGEIMMSKHSLNLNCILRPGVWLHHMFCQYLVYYRQPDIRYHFYVRKYLLTD